MISESDALDRILSELTPLRPGLVALDSAAGRFSATALTAPVSLPRFDQSAMDGYAIRTGDAPGPLRVTGEQPAGPNRHLQLGPGEAIRIFTGAPIPSGANAVVMQEDVERTTDFITLKESTASGEFIRPAGADLCAGQQILAPGDRLTPARIGLLAALAIDQIEVHALPRIGLISTGDEVRPAGEPLGDGEIPNSNLPMLRALLTSCGFPVTIATHARDSASALEAALEETRNCDAVILSGGVSVGDHDHVRPTLQSRGVAPSLWRIAVKPGKPFLFGHSDSTAFFGLPGNPVSTLVTAILFVIPGLRRLAGASSASARPIHSQLKIASALDNPGDRPHYLRGSAENGFFMPTPLQESHALASLARSDTLLRIPANSSFAPESILPTILLPGF